MYQEIADLFMYGGLDQNSILCKIGNIIHEFETSDCDKTDLKIKIKTELKRLLALATDYGFDKNLWHNYIAFFIMMNENPFSLVFEKKPVGEGTVNQIVKADLSLIRKIFLYDFSPLEQALGINSFSLISNYHAVEKNRKIYNWNVSRKVQKLSEELENAADDEEFYERVIHFYSEYGVGLFGLNKAFRIDELPSGDIKFNAINNMDTVVLDDLIGYEIQKQKLIDNTEAFVRGIRANNVLLYGDSGTGKSTCIKAIVNQYYDRGLRMVEIYKHQFRHLSTIISTIKNRNYRFIIYMDDLSFEESEIEYKFLKAVIEGGVETKPDNILIYATSNRRHIIKESWSDKDDRRENDDIHHSDTVEEKLSLAKRFGVTIGFSKPLPKEYAEIVFALAERAGIDMDREQLKLEATRWEMSHGGISGRTARQFIDHLLYQQSKQS